MEENILLRSNLKNINLHKLKMNKISYKNQN